MSQFKNVSGLDLDVRIDGLPVPVADGVTFTVPDEFDSQFVEQPNFTQVKSKSAPAAEQGE